MKRFHYIIATGFGLGYSPLAPGTAGSLLALLMAFFIFRENYVILISAAIIFFGIGIVSATFVEKDQGSEDPGLIVVDEMVGMWIGLLFVPRLWWTFLLAFLLFRLFDILKPFPINAVQKLNNGWGIIMDDVLAGIYTLVTMHLLLWVTG